MLAQRAGLGVGLRLTLNFHHGQKGGGDAELAIVRRAYAEQIMTVMGTEDARVEATFAEVRREHFLGNGPWQILHWSDSRAAAKTGDHVAHIGAGVGYYTAHICSSRRSRGRSIEFDEALAQRASTNFRQWPHVTLVHGGGAAVDFDAADVIYANAGATRPR